MHTPFRRCLFAGAFAVSLSLANAAASDEVIKLNEFTVGAKADRGYLASETVSGSRVATAIKDLPYSVNVVTSEFLEDFGVLEGTTQAFAYTSSVAAIDLSGTGNDGRRYSKLPAYTRLDLAAHYQFKAAGRYRQTVSVLLKNAGDSRFAEYLRSNSTASDRRGVYATYKLGY